MAFLVVDNYVLDDGDAGGAFPKNRAVEGVTVAVLPFVAVPSVPEQQSFADGLAIELISSLQRLPGLRVMGQTTSFAFRGRTAREISAALGVQYVLEGSVSSDGDRLRVNLQLSDGAGFGVWPYNHEGRFESIFDVQDEIVRGVAQQLGATLGLDQALQQASTDSLDAYRLYLAAAAEPAATSPETGARALDLLEQALRIDPEFADALSLKSRVLSVRTILFSGEERVSMLADAEQAALRAIAFAPAGGSGYAARAQVLGIRGDWLGAERDWREAVGSGANDFTGYSVFLMSAGRFEKASDVLQQALEINPLDGQLLGMLMLAQEMLGDSGAADASYRRGQQLYNNDWFGRLVARPWIRLGRGQAEPEDEELIDPFSRWIADPEGALAELSQMVLEPASQSPSALLAGAFYAAYAGDSRLGLQLLEEGVSDFGVTMYLVWLPVFEDVRQLPEFKDFLIKIGLADYWRSTGWPEVCRPAGRDFECV